MEEKMFQTGPRAERALRRALADERGLTLVEILVVLTILGILATLVATNVIGAACEAKADATRVQIADLRSPLTRFHLDHGRYPSTSEGLEALVNPPPGRNGRKFAAYIQGDKAPLDSWGNPFQYFSPGSHGNAPFEMVSLGGDAKEGGEGCDADINSWEM